MDGLSYQESEVTCPCYQLEDLINEGWFTHELRSVKCVKLSTSLQDATLHDAAGSCQQDSIMQTVYTFI